MVYVKPKKRVHRGFLYLDDETVINSLSAVEAGKIDEVVQKINSAREGGFGGGVGYSGAKVEGGKKSSSAFEEEIVRTRTRFSVFEIWHQNLAEADAIGRFDGWGPKALDDMQVGDTVEFTASVEVAPIQTLLRSFLWFAEQAKTQGHLFSQKGEELKGTKEAERNIKMVLGGEENDETVLLAKPTGEEGPVVAMAIRPEWLIGDLSRVGGDYTVVAQVDRILAQGEEYLTMRLIGGLPPSGLEINSMKEGMSNFVEPAKEMGFIITANDATITGPGLWLSPIAIFR